MLAACQQAVSIICMTCITYSLRISASRWFYYKNISRCTVLWTSNPSVPNHYLKNIKEISLLYLKQPLQTTSQFCGLFLVTRCFDNVYELCMYCVCGTLCPYCVSQFKSPNIRHKRKQCRNTDVIRVWWKIHTKLRANGNLVLIKCNSPLNI
jgi:hypothetical protein